MSGMLQCVRSEGRGYSVSGQTETATVCQALGTRLHFVKLEGRGYSMSGQKEEVTLCQA